MTTETTIAITIMSILVATLLLYMAYLAGAESVVSHYELYKEYGIEMQCRIIKEE